MGDYDISNNYEKLKVGYARTSQDTEDIQRQVYEIHNMGVPEHLIFCDDVRSGVTDAQKRPGYSQLFNLIITGAVKELYVTDLSRLGRDARSTLKELWDIQDRNISVISLSALDTGILAAPKELQPLLQSAILLGADLQRKKVQEDTKSGLARAKARGVKLGRPQTIFDFDKIDFYMRRGLSEHAAARACGYHPSTYYRFKRANKDESRNSKLKIARTEQLHKQALLKDLHSKFELELKALKEKWEEFIKSTNIRGNPLSDWHKSEVIKKVETEYIDRRKQSEITGQELVFSEATARRVMQDLLLQWETDEEDNEVFRKEILEKYNKSNGVKKT